MTIVGSNGGGGGGDGNNADFENSGYIIIEYPTTASSYTTYCDAANLGGEAFISPTWWRCCSGSAEDTGVTVTWENKTTGQNGFATQNVDICYSFGIPYLCNHTWHAEVPLALGDNLINVRSTDPSGNTGKDSITVTKPEYSYDVSGSVTNTSGTGIGYHGASVEINLTGENINMNGVTGADGKYSFACIPNGSYTVTPSSNMNYIYEPLNRIITVNNTDVSGVDFVTEVYFISGNIRRENGTAVSGILVELSCPDFSAFYPSTTNEGFYEFAVPNGTYTITPHDWLGYYAFDPMSTVVTINNEDIVDSNFLAYP